MPSTDANGQLSVQQLSVQYLPPRDDLNSPDMYIPIMSLITYILLSTVLAGMRGSFQPELLGQITTTAVSIVLVEILILKLAMYILSINNDSQLLDLMAYSGYKFVGVIVTLFVAEVFTRGGGTNNWVGWVIFVYTWYANAFFLVSKTRRLSNTSMLIPIASVTQVCSATRCFERYCLAWWRSLHGRASAKEPSNIFPGVICFRHTAFLHVDIEPRRISGEDSYVEDHRAEISIPQRYTSTNKHEHDVHSEPRYRQNKMHTTYRAFSEVNVSLRDTFDFPPACWRYMPRAPHSKRSWARAPEPNDWDHPPVEL